MSDIYRIEITHRAAYVEASSELAAMQLYRQRITEGKVIIAEARVATVDKLPEGAEFLR